jgi:EmrB/QacA subfamily drug resistance transporter
MGFIDGSAVNVALPVMQRELRASAVEIQWVAEGYLLFLSALILIGGALGDRFGRRKLFGIGTVLFAVSSLACAAASTPALLIGARCVQGIGGALMIPGSLALITAAYDQRSRGGAIGTWSAASAMTTALAPLLGGWLTQAFSWRAVFLINPPLAAVVLWLTYTRVEESRAPRELCEPDVAGSAVITLSLGLLVFGMSELQRAGVQTSTISALIGGVALLALFVFIERRARIPIVPPELFASRTFTMDNVYTLLMYAALSGGLFLVPFDLISLRGYSPAAAGTALLAFAVPISVFSGYAGALAARTDPRMWMAAGAFVTGGGFVLFALLPGTSYWTNVFPAAFVGGIGASMFVAPLTTSVMDAAPQEFAGAASGINNAIARAAGMLAIAGLGIIAHPLLAHSPNAAAAFAGAMFAAAALSVASALSALALRSGAPHR